MRQHLIHRGGAEPRRKTRRKMEQHKLNYSSPLCPYPQPPSSSAAPRLGVELSS
jgi:hypothetical protein